MTRHSRYFMLRPSGSPPRALRRLAGHPQRPPSPLHPDLDGEPAENAAALGFALNQVERERFPGSGVWGKPDAEAEENLIVVAEADWELGRTPGREGQFDPAREPHRGSVRCVATEAPGVPRAGR